MKKLLILTVILLGAGTNSAQAREVSVTKTAYCLQGKMADGNYVHPGAIAVDPNVIPLGTRLYVPGYGWGTAEDTGGDINGYHIDVWMASCSLAMTSTRYNLKIYIPENHAKIRSHKRSESFINERFFRHLFKVWSKDYHRIF